MTQSRRGSNAQRPKKADSRWWETFFTGLLLGAALSAVVPWERLGSDASSVRLASLAILGASLAVTGMLFAGRLARQVAGILLICFGGLLMSASAQWSPADWPVSPVGVGAFIFLCGVMLLLRGRRIPTQQRQRTVDRLIEEPIKDDEPDLTLDRLLAMERLQESEPPQDRPGRVRPRLSKLDELRR